MKNLIEKIKYDVIEIRKQTLNLHKGDSIDLQRLMIKQYVSDYLIHVRNRYKMGYIHSMHVICDSSNNQSNKQYAIDISMIMNEIHEVIKIDDHTISWYNNSSGIPMKFFKYFTND